MVACFLFPQWGFPIRLSPIVCHENDDNAKLQACMKFYDTRHTQDKLASVRIAEACLKYEPKFKDTRA